MTHWQLATSCAIGWADQSHWGHCDTVKCQYARCRINPYITTRLSSVSLLLRLINQIYEQYVLYMGMTVSETVAVEWHWTFIQCDTDKWWGATEHLCSNNTIQYESLVLCTFVHLGSWQGVQWVGSMNAQLQWAGCINIAQIFAVLPGTA